MKSVQSVSSFSTVYIKDNSHNPVKDRHEQSAVYIWDFEGWRTVLRLDIANAHCMDRSHNTADP